MDNFKTKLEIVLEGDAGNRTNGILFNKIREYLSHSGRLKNPMSSGEISLNQIVTAIKNERCLRTSERDLGNTYLEQMVGSAIRKTIPAEFINQARELFGMPKFTPSELKKEKKKRRHEAPTLQNRQ